MASGRNTAGMDINRHEDTGRDADRMVGYCLDTLEMNEFTDGIEWDTNITDDLTIEEVVGALVQAEVEADE